MSYVATGFTPDQEKLLISRSGQMVAMQKSEESRRRWTTLLAIAGATLAAARLGIIAFPLIKKRRRVGML